MPCRLLPLLSLFLVACADESAPPPSRPTPTPTPQPTPIRTWVTGDTHMHSQSCQEDATPDELVQTMADRGVNVGAALVWGIGYALDLPNFTGLDHPASRPGHILHYDLEISDFNADQTGHLVLLGLREIVFSEDPFTKPLAGVPIVDWARAQDPRVLVGISHGWAWPADGSLPVPNPRYCCIIPMDMPVHAARGVLDFLQLDVVSTRPGEVMEDGARFLWTAVQNAGLRVPLAGGTDNGCNVYEIGDIRTQALVEGELFDLDYERFLDAVRADRTAVTVDRARVDLHAKPAQSSARVGIGGELHIQAGTTVELQTEIDQPIADTLTLTVNGEPAQTAAIAAGTSSVVFQVTLAESSWLAVRSSRVQTSALYVLLDGAPIRSVGSSCYLLRYMRHLIRLVETNGFPNGRIDSVLPAYFEARDVYERLFREAGGEECR